MRITGSDARNSVASAFSSTPTDTSPITRPCAFRIGAFARIDWPSDPGCSPTNVLPAKTGAGLSPGSCSSDFPIIFGFGCDMRMPRRFATTTKDAPVARLIRSAIGSMIRAPFGCVSAATTCRSVATVCAIASDSAPARFAMSSRECK